MKNRYLWIVLLVALCALPLLGQKTNKKKPVKELPATKIDYSETYKDEWLSYSSNRYSVFYYNPARAEREGPVMRMWTMIRDKSDEATISKLYFEINCNTKKERMIAGIDFYDIIYTVGGKRERLAITPKSYEIREAPWNTIIPDTYVEHIYKIACKEEW